MVTCQTLIRSFARRGLRKTISMFIHEIIYEWLYHLNSKISASDAINQYMPSSFFLSVRLFKKLFLFITPDQIDFFDYGSGKGRILILAAKCGIQRISGIEIQNDLFLISQQNINEAQKKLKKVKFDVFQGDAELFELNPRINVIYFYNPFSFSVTKNVLTNLISTFKSSRKTLYVMYLNPEHLALWTENSFEIIEKVSSGNYLEGVLLKRSFELTEDPPFSGH